MDQPTMLYKCPGPHEIHGGHFETLIVDESDVEEALADGWHLTTPDAKAAHEAEKEAEKETPAGAPTRKDMLARAVELGLSHKHNISNVALAELIAEAEKA